MKVFLLRRFNFIGIGVVLLWFLSPLGSQMSLRLLSLTETSTMIPTTVPYFRTFAADVNSLADINIPQPRSLFTNYQPDSDSRQSRNPMLSALLGASMLGADTVRKSPQDQYGNFRIPHLPSLPPGVWSEVPEKTDSWASFTGLIVSDKALNDSSNFIVDSAYISASYSDSTKLPHKNDLDLLARTIQKAGFHQHAGVSKGNSKREAAFTGPDGNSDNTILIDSNSLDNPDEAVGKDAQDKDIFKSSLTYLPGPVNLFYASQTRWLDDHSSIDLFNCTLTYPRIQANITCAGKNCNTTHLRPSGQKDASMPFGLGEYGNFLRFLPSSLGSSGHKIAPVAIDQYMLGSPSPMAQGDEPYKKNFDDVPGDVFGARLTALLNTVWQASIAKGNIAFGSAADFNAITTSDTRASVTQTEREGQYTVNRWHAGLLLAISILLLACAVASTIIAKRTRAPDVLGYVSSFTRDNAAFEGIRGGTTLDGVDRARLMGEVKVRLGDPRGEEEVGFITLMNLDGETGGYGGGLVRDRKYL